MAKRERDSFGEVDQKVAYEDRENVHRDSRKNFCWKIERSVNIFTKLLDRNAQGLIIYLFANAVILDSFLAESSSLVYKVNCLVFSLSSLCFFLV